MPHAPSLLIWLLLGATLAVDAVALVGIAVTRLSHAWGTLFLGLAYGQLSLLALWAVARRNARWRWIAPFGLGALAGLAATYAEGIVAPDNLVAFIGMFWFHVVATLILVWLARPWTGAHGAEAPPWRFSMLNLLVVTTVAALLVALLGRNKLLGGAAESITILVAGNLVLLAIVLAAYRSIHGRWLRLAVVLGTALGVGVVCDFSGTGFTEHFNFIAMLLIQSLVVWLWLEVTGAGRSEVDPVAPA